jgi:hypothetical protein
LAEKEYIDLQKRQAMLQRKTKYYPYASLQTGGILKKTVSEKEILKDNILAQKILVEITDKK